jgi:hypothetical protein
VPEPAAFAIRDVTGEDPQVILDVLRDGYGRTFSREWFEWKHRSSPWGPSRCWLAADEAGPLGVVFGLPWRYQSGGRIVVAARLVDGATTPRSARRGVFRAVVRNELDAWPDGIVIATATPEAQGAHVKNGAIALEPIHYVYRPTWYSPARTDSGPHVLDGCAPPETGARWTTAWDAPAMRWRTDARSGIDYEVSRLAQADVVHGIVHRVVVTKAVRTLVITASWGPQREVDQLIRALAVRRACALVLAPRGDGAALRERKPYVARGRSLLCVWRTIGDASRCSERKDWALQGADLEGVI